MSFNTMAKGITGEIPGTPLRLAQRKIRQAQIKIYNSFDWSFKTFYAGWLAPGLRLSVGTYTVTPFSPTVIADATATAALATLTGQPVITQLQYRDPSRAIYSIIDYDTTTNAPFATLTLNRPWMEPTEGPGQPYFIYQAYFPVPFKDFDRFVEVRDTTNARYLDFTSYSQADLAREDPQRTDFADPRFVVQYEIDRRPGSSTFGNMLYELWPQQLSRVPYSFSGRRRGPLLETPTDELLHPLTEELVEARAIELLAAWKEAQKQEGKDDDRGAGANWPFLIKYWGGIYKEELAEVQAVDLNLHNDLITRIDRYRGIDSNQPFSNRLGQLNIGGYPQ